MTVVAASILYTEVSQKDAWRPPFSFDRSIPLPMLTDKTKQNMNVGCHQETVFPSSRRRKLQPSWPSGVRKERVLDYFRRERRFSTVIIFLMDPFKLNFITASSFEYSKGFHFSSKINEPDDGYGLPSILSPKRAPDFQSFCLSNKKKLDIL